MKNLIENKCKIKIEDLLEYLMIFLIIVQAVKKGGFYISDFNYIAVFVISISFIYTIIKIRKNSLKMDISHAALGMLATSYVFPIIFGRAADYNSAVWEAVKYLEMFSIYLVITNSSKLKKYKITLIIIGIIIGLLGIDGIASRILENFLKQINSGYLSSYLERLSSTIQYANTCGIILMISFVFALDYTLKSVKKMQENYIIQNVNVFKLLYSITGFLLICILLTQSRFVIALTLAMIIFICISNKENKFINSIISISILLISTIFTSSILEQIYKDYFIIYIIVVIAFAILNICSHLLISGVIMNIKLWLKLEHFEFKKSKYKIAIALTITALYILLAFSLHTSIVLEANDKNLFIEREINITNTDEIYKVSAKVNKLQEDSKYEIEVYEVLKDNNEKLVANFSNIGSEEGNFFINLKPNSNSKRCVFRVNCIEGKVQIENITVNNKKVPLKYILIPTEIVCRFKKQFLGSVSTNVRVEYVKDAFKIFKTSPIVGRGGEAFRYLYKDFKTQDYSSTEVHSSIIQIMIESGIIGLSSILIFVIYKIVKGKNTKYKVIFLAFLLHSLFDLNFSYTISTMVFAILSSLIKNKYYENKS